MAEQSARLSDAPAPAHADDPFSPENTTEIAAATKPKRPHRYGPEMIKHITDETIDLVLEHLRTQAKGKPDGALTFAEIHAEIAAYKASPGDGMARLHRDGWDQCMNAAKALHWERERTPPLERLMLNNFAHLLPPVDVEPAVQGKHLSRRLVGPFGQVLAQLLGPESFERYRDGCQRMVDRLQAKHGADFTWELVLAEPTAQTVVNDVLVYMSRHFLAPRKRRRWMIDLVTSSMPPATDAAEKQWQFGDREFHMLMDALYYGLRNALDSEDGKHALSKRYTDATVAKIYSMLQALDHDYMEVMRGENSA